MHQHRMWLFLMFLNIAHDIINSVHLDIDETLVLKICQMKFCGATKTNVSVIGIHKVSTSISFFSTQCDLVYCIEQMASEIKFGDCPSYSNISGTQVNCFDDCDGQDYR